MSNIIKMASTLALIAVLSALLLTGLNLWTTPIMEANQAQQHLELLQQFFPEAKDTSEDYLEGIVYDVVLDDKENFLGLLALAEVSGYGGIIRYYLAIDSEALIEGVYILSHAETPGIGCVITEEEFQKEILNIDIKDSFVIGEDVDTVTGATVTTEAFLNSVIKVIEVAANNYY